MTDLNYNKKGFNSFDMGNFLNDWNVASYNNDYMNFFPLKSITASTVQNTKFVLIHVQKSAGLKFTIFLIEYSQTQL